MAEETQQKKIITILSIDGGGIRGIIPGTILCLLEELLQEIDGEKARIADYFDIIAGTSTGSLIAALLVAPENGNGRPRTASEIVDFYKQDGPIIFSKESKLAHQASLRCGEAPEGSSWGKIFHYTRKYVKKSVKKFTDPIYDRKHLDDKISDLFGDLKLSDTPKNIVIPAFDMKAKSPVVFSNKQVVKRFPNITLANAIIASSAAPYYFPSLRFSIEEQDHELIDGGIAANNPVLLAIGEAKKLYPEYPETFKYYRILSIGTGIVDGKNMPELLIGRGGILDLLVNSSGGTPPLIEMMFRANAFTTDMYTSTMLGKFNKFPYYLRIQEYDLKKELDVMNTTSVEILDDLQKVALELMEKPVSVSNACTGMQEEVKGPGSPNNNGDALVKLALMLTSEKKSCPTMDC